MKAIVVYESLWGNTAAIARAIAEGIGPEVRAERHSNMTTE
jgi:flavodoxin